MVKLKRIKLNVKTNELVALILVAFLVLLSVHTIRYFFNNNILFGDENYYYLRNAESIRQDFSFIDKVTNRPIYDFGWPLLLAIFNSVLGINIELLCRFLPLLIGLFTVVIFYLVLGEFDLEEKIKSFSCLLLIFSPPFIYSYSSCNNYGMAIFLSLLAFYYFLKDKIINSLVILILLSFFGISNIILLFLLSVIGIFLRYRKKFFVSLKYFGIVFLVYSIFKVPFWVKYGLPERVIFNVLDKEFLFQHIFSDLGGLTGISIFTFLLAGLGLVSTWNKKSKYSLLYVSVLFLLILFLRNPSISFYLNLLLIVLVVYGFIFVIHTRWESELIKKMIIIVLIVGILFSSFSYIKFLYTLEPNQKTLDGLNVLKLENETGVVFTYYANGNLVETITKKEALLDTVFVYNKNVNNKWEDSNKLFHTTDINTTIDIINTYNIKYIVIDKKMREGLIWERKDEGLLFLLKSTTTKFKKLYDNNEVEVWEIT